MKGIYQQMRERDNVISDYKITKEVIEEFKKIFIEAEKKDRKLRNERQKEIKENYKHLKAKSKELGKEIPFYLEYVLCNPSRIFVGSEFLETYKEWL